MLPPREAIWKNRKHKKNCNHFCPLALTHSFQWPRNKEKIWREATFFGSFIFHVRSFHLYRAHGDAFFSLFLFLVQIAVWRAVSIFTLPDSEAHPLAISFVCSNCWRHYFFQHSRLSVFQVNEINAFAKFIWWECFLFSDNVQYLSLLAEPWNYKIRKKKTLSCGVRSARLHFISRSIIRWKNIKYKIQHDKIPTENAIRFCRCEFRKIIFERKLWLQNA